MATRLLLAAGVDLSRVTKAVHENETKVTGLMKHNHEQASALKCAGTLSFETAKLT